MYDTPELQRAIAQLQRGYRLPLELVRELQDQGFDPESLARCYTGRGGENEV
jgi:hypothetical protein